MRLLLSHLHHHDVRILHALLRRRCPWLNRLMWGLTHLGGTTVVVVTLFLLLTSNNPWLARLGVHATVAVALSHAWVQLLKRTLCRARPELPVGILSLVRAPDRFSFPSGHATASMALALATSALLSTPVGLILLGVASLVGLSRCYLGVHYPGDVMVGWGLAGGAHLLTPWLLG